MDYYKLDAKQVLKELESKETGLTETEAKIRLDEYGPNIIKEEKKISKFGIFLRQFKNILVAILIIAVVISFFLGDLIDAVVILAIVIANAIFGFWQEFKAEKSIEALKKLATPKAKVLREGVKEISSTELVPGDIILLEEGDRIPADARLLECISLEADESSLTGESLPISKVPDALEKDLAIPDRKNMVWVGTAITRGRAKAVVVSTGMNTEIGEIAKEIQVREEETPLQKKLKVLGDQLGLIIILISAFVALAGFFILNLEAWEALKTGIALAVAAIPEGLPAVATLTLAIGIRKMSKNNAVVRKLPSVETLGSCTVICSDKTGTITKSELTAKKIYTDKTYEVEKLDPKQSELLLRTAVLCNNSDLESGLGDPTELALLKLAKQKGFDKKELNKKFPRKDEILFSSERKRMSVVTDKEVYSKGAVEIILKSCSHFYKDGKVVRLLEKDRKQILEANNRLTQEALRVLGFSYKTITIKKQNHNQLEQDHVFLGLIGMIDPPRDEVKEAIKTCKQAGIRVVMITGDHVLTAEAVGRQIGLDGVSLTGIDLDKISDEELKERVKTVNIFARVSPQHKLRILTALKANGEIVAMTGDGINDAPALKKADIGISMGIKGTDVAKEASDMVLEDDNFSTIVSSVKEGRRIYDNIKSFVQYLLSANTSEVLIIFLAILLSAQFRIEHAIPLTALQILWLNLVTDGLPALALGTDPAGKSIMQRKPRDPKEKILSKDMLVSMIFFGVLLALPTLSVFYLTLPQGLIKAQTIAFTTLVVLELVISQTVRMRQKLGFFSNKNLIYAIISSFALQLLVLYLPPFQVAFDTVALDIYDWGKIVIFPALLFVGAYVYYKIRNNN